LIDRRRRWADVWLMPSMIGSAATVIFGLALLSFVVSSMGFSVAFNDTATATLELESYVASQSARGSATRFSVQNLPDSRAVKVVRDGAGYGAWRATSATSIEIETDIDDHAYEIYTGYRGVRRAAIDRAVGSSGSAGSATVRANRASLVEIVGAVGSVRAGTAGCPCCVATMA
jgi:hypothetical protein